MPRIRLETLGVTVLVALALASPLSRDLFIGDETKYGQVVREMHADEALLVPTLNGSPYTHKPPLHFWLMYALTTIGGQSTPWPYVLPALASYLSLIWLAGFVARRWLGADSELRTRFFVGGMALVWGLAQTARMDLMFAALMTGGIYFFYRYVDSDTMTDALLAGLAFGVAGLVKGPMAIVIAGSLYIIESIATRRRPRFGDVAILSILAAIPLAWFVAAVSSAGPGFFDEIVGRQTTGRLVRSWVHREPFWYYLIISPAIVLPWFFPTFSSLASTTLTEGETRRAMQRCVRWILALVIPFSLISSKLPIYMIPALPPVAILLSSYVSSPREEMRWRGFALVGNRLTAGLFLVVGAAIAMSGGSLVAGGVAVLLSEPMVRVSFGLMSVLGITALIVGWNSVRRSSFALPFVVAIPIGVMLLTAGAPINDYASTRRLVRVLEAHYQPGDEVAVYYTPHLWGRDLPPGLEQTRQVDDEQLRRDKPDLLVVRRDKVDRVDDVIDEYKKVSSVTMIGKSFDVFRRD